MNYQQFPSQPLPQNRQVYPHLQKYPQFATPTINVRPQLIPQFQLPVQYYNNPQIYAQSTPTYQYQPNEFLCMQPYHTQASNEYYQAPMELSYAPPQHKIQQNQLAAFEIEEKSTKEHEQKNPQSNPEPQDEEIKKAKRFGALSCASTFMAVLYLFLALMQLFGASTFRVDFYTRFEPNLQQGLYLAIFALTVFKIPVFVSGNLAVKDKSLSKISLFISALIAHILFITICLFAAATFYPWIFKGVVMIYIMASFLEAMWFLPFAFAFKSHLEKLKGGDTMTTSETSI